MNKVAFLKSASKLTQAKTTLKESLMIPILDTSLITSNFNKQQIKIEPLSQVLDRRDGSLTEVAPNRLDDSIFEPQQTEQTELRKNRAVFRSSNKKSFAPSGASSSTKAT